MAAFFAIPAVAGGVMQVVRAATPYIAKELTKRFGAKRISKIAADKINKNPSTITKLNQIKPTRPALRASTKVVKPKSGVTSQQRSALSNMGGQTVKLSKPTSGTGRATLKPKTPSVKAQSPSVKAQRPSVKPKPKVVQPRASAPKAPPSRPSVPSGGSRFTGFPRRPTPPKAPPSRPITRGQRAANVGKTAAALGTAAYMLPKIKEGAKSTAKATIPTPKPRPKTKEGGPGRKFAKPSEGKDPRGNQIKPTPGKTVMPKKFQGSYNKDTHKLSNITINGKKSTYVLPKNMTSSKAKSLLTGTVKKKAGGTPGKYKGFSKLPEKVQKKMSPTLAAKYKGGGSIGISKVARQVRGFGAARKPKK